jgi:hypothetical protein
MVPRRQHEGGGMEERIADINIGLPTGKLCQSHGIGRQRTN